MFKQSKSVLLLFLTAIIWGFAFVAQLIGASYVETFTFNGTRFLIGALSLLPVIFIFERVEISRAKMKKTIISGVVAGVILFTASTLQQFGVILTGSAGKSGFITGLYTVLVPLLGIFIKKKTNFNTWLGAVLAVVGLYLLSFSDGISNVGVGDLVLLIGAVMWAMHIIVIDEFGGEIYSIRFAMTQFIVCAVLSIIGALLFEDISFAAILDAKYPILYAGIMSVGVAYTCQILGQKNSDPTFAAIILSTESMFSAIGEAIVLGIFLTGFGYKPLSFRAYIGCAIIFCGIIVSQLNFKKTKLSVK